MRKRPSAAMVVAIVALFFSLAGTAEAAFLITSNSQVGVGTIAGHRPPAGAHANIIRGSIGGRDLADASVPGRAITADAVTGGSVLDGSLGGLDLADASISGQQVDESSLSGVNADTLDGLDSSAFPRQTGIGGAQNTGLRWGSTLFRTQVQGEDVNFGSVHLKALDTPEGGKFRVCTNPSVIEQIPLVVELRSGSGSVTVTRTLLTTTSGVPCSGTITVGVGDTFQVTARGSIVFGWEPTSNNAAPHGFSFAVVGFTQG